MADARYVTRKTTKLFEQDTGTPWHMILIFGDEVEVTGPKKNKRFPVTFRERAGWIDEGHLGADPVLEMYFIDVGQGDSTFIVTPGRKTIPVDGGIDDSALRFLAWKYRLDRPGNVAPIDLLVLTHGDEDHLVGLRLLLEDARFDVKRIVHSGVASYKKGAHDTELGKLAEHAGVKYIVTRHDKVTQLTGQLSDAFKGWKAAVQRAIGDGATYGAVHAGDGTIDVGDPSVTIEVLGPVLTQVPGAPKAYRWFGDKAHTINGHSVVLRLRYGLVGALLSGDLNIEGSQHLMAEPSVVGNLAAHVLKAPHHGSHEYHRPLLEAVRPQLSVISSGDDPDHGHPRASFLGVIGAASRSPSPLLFSTEIAATFVEDKRVHSADDPAADRALESERKTYKRRLHGMINVRTDGQKIVAARRVAAGYWWESYEVSPHP